MDSNVYADEIQSNGVFMFVDKETGACCKPASYKAPAKGIRFCIDFLADHPEVVDPLRFLPVSPMRDVFPTHFANSTNFLSTNQCGIASQQKLNLNHADQDIVDEVMATTWECSQLRTIS